MTRTHLGGARTAVLLAALAALVIALLPPGASAQPAEDADPAPDDVEVTRFAGGQRYATARLIAEGTFEQSDTAVIAKAEDWPDALAGNYLAGLFDAPILLVSRTGVQADTLAALEALGVEEVALLGGEAAISSGNVQTLEDAGYSVERIAGTTRYETAAELATAILDADDEYVVGEWEGQRTAIVATGQQFADALVSGAAAWAEQLPLLLTPTASLHPAADDALDELEIERVIIPGGTAAVSPAVQTAIEAKGIEVTRISGGPGTGRWETAISFADFAVEEFGFDYETVSIATGFDFPDALTMGARAGWLGSPLLLTPGTAAAPTPTLDAHLRDTACWSWFVDIAGGTAAVSQGNEDAIVDAANDCVDEPTDPASATTGRYLGDVVAFDTDDDLIDVELLEVAAFDDEPAPDFEVGDLVRFDYDEDDDRFWLNDPDDPEADEAGNVSITAEEFESFLDEAADEGYGLALGVTYQEEAASDFFLYVEVVDGDDA